MQEGLLYDLFDNWDNILGVVTGLLSLGFGIYKYNKKILKFFFGGLFKCFRNKKKDKAKQEAEKLFDDLLPLLEEYYFMKLDVVIGQLNDQQITIQSSISEMVEFKEFVNKKLTILSDTLKEVASAVDTNTLYSKQIKECIEDSDK